MRSSRAVVVTALTFALILPAGTPGPATAAGPVGRVVAQVDTIACNPNGAAGLRVSASATATSGSILAAQLFVGEFRPVVAPYAPFAWTGMTVANWQSENGYRGASGVADQQTLDTTDRATWDRGSFATDIWSGSRADAWWYVGYSVRPSSRSADWTSVGRYVNCATAPATVVDAASITEIAWTEQTGDR